MNTAKFCLIIFKIIPFSPLRTQKKNQPSHEENEIAKKTHEFLIEKKQEQENL